MTDNQKHLVVFDKAGMYQDRARYTCYSSQCDCATLIYHDWMNGATWKHKFKEFSENHPHEKVLTWQEYLLLEDEDN